MTSLMYLASLHRLILCALFICLSFLETPNCIAATVRGRIVRSNGNFPVPYVTVTLASPERGRSAPAVTGFDGMYYLYNVPPGPYVLELWLGQRPATYPITVQDPVTDIPPLPFP